MHIITVDIVSDVVCPWCYIGKRRLEKAMDLLKTDFAFEVNYFPFELNPQMPKEGRKQKEYLIEKFGGEDRYKQLTENVSKIAADEGIEFNYDRQVYSPNTRDAHRLIWLAKSFNRQGEIKEALLKAYFTDGVDLTKKANLIETVSQSGLDRDKAEKLLDSEEGIAEVKFYEQANIQRGISGVPYYIIDNKYGISGAQPTKSFINAFLEIAKDQNN